MAEPSARFAAPRRVLRCPGGTGRAPRGPDTKTLGAQLLTLLAAGPTLRRAARGGPTRVRGPLSAPPEPPPRRLQLGPSHAGKGRRTPGNPAGRRARSPPLPRRAGAHFARRASRDGEGACQRRGAYVRRHCSRDAAVLSPKSRLQSICGRSMQQPSRRSILRSRPPPPPPPLPPPPIDALRAPVAILGGERGRQKEGSVGTGRPRAALRVRLRGLGSAAPSLTAARRRPRSPARRAPAGRRARLHSAPFPHAPSRSGRRSPGLAGLPLPLGLRTLLVPRSVPLLPAHLPAASGARWALPTR